MSPGKNAKPSKNDSFTLAYAEEDLIHRVAERVYNIRTRLGLSQKELAERVGTKQPRIAMIEGGYENLSLRRIVRLASALGCAADDLLLPGTPTILREHKVEKKLIEGR